MFMMVCNVYKLTDIMEQRRYLEQHPVFKSEVVQAFGFIKQLYRKLRRCGSVLLIESVLSPNL